MSTNTFSTWQRKRPVWGWGCGVIYKEMSLLQTQGGPPSPPLPVGPPSPCLTFPLFPKLLPLSTHLFSSRCSHPSFPHHRTLAVSLPLSTASRTLRENSNSPGLMSTGCTQQDKGPDRHGGQKRWRPGSAFGLFLCEASAGLQGHLLCPVRGGTLV